ncbi:GNAT family N-acetyltransferase [Pacificoceanicola onchidii]|uniref:GNAT family N-acetyltransferase n=1 Tax=Pacificoceanicola onchidii TaxID=2562685 RepID=UPI0010A67B55|nr:GNAT family N-acetyltransferase [Pacificoceanicola onchidii]
MTVTLAPFSPDDIDWLVEAHQSQYAQDEGFDESFGALVAQILNDFAADHDPERERGFIAWEDGQRLGCIFCVRLSDETAKLRLFFLTPDARGKGLGKRLLQANMDFAKDAGYRRMELWTHESHRAACALYAAHGWVLRASKPVTSFGVPLIEQAWDIDLSLV